MLEKAVKVAERANYTIVRFHNVVVLHWTGTPSMDALAHLNIAFSNAGDGNIDGKIGFLTIMEEETLDQATPNDVRVGMSDLLQRYHDSICATSIVFEGAGLKAFIVRGMISAINLMSRSTFPSSVQSNVTIAAEWLVSHMQNVTSVKGWYLTQLVVDLRIERAATAAKLAQEAQASAALLSA